MYMYFHLADLSGREDTREVLFEGALFRGANENDHSAARQQLHHSLSHQSTELNNKVRKQSSSDCSAPTHLRLLLKLIQKQR